MARGFGGWLFRRPWLDETALPAHFIRRCSWRSLRKAVREVLLFFVITIANPYDIVGWTEQRSHDLMQQAGASAYPGAQGGKSVVSLAARVPVAAPGRDNIMLFYFDDLSVQRQFGDGVPNSADLLQLIDDIDHAADADLKQDPQTHLFAFAQGRAPAAILIDFDLQHAAPVAVPADTLIGDASLDPARTGALVRQCDVRSATDPHPPSPFVCLVVGISEITHYPQWRTNPRCQANALAKLGCIRDHGGVPIVIAGGTGPSDERKAGSTLPPLSPAFAALAQIAVLSPPKVGVYEYPLADYRAPDLPDSRFVLSPAAAMYAAWCMAGHCAMPRPGSNSPVEWPDAFRHDLDVHWAVGRPADQRAAVGDSQLQELGGSCQSRGVVGWLMREMVHGLIAADTRPACRYVRALPFNIFQTSLTPGEFAGLTDGKLVLIGGQFAGSPDLVPAAPYGALPGVYLHAMALDNLVEYGSGYPRPVEAWLGGMKWQHWPVALTIFLGALAISFALPFLESEDEATRKALRTHNLETKTIEMDESPHLSEENPENSQIKSSEFHNFAIAVVEKYDILRRVFIFFCVCIVILSIYAVFFGIVLWHPFSAMPRNYNFIEGVTFSVLRLIELFWATVYPFRHRFVAACALGWRGLWGDGHRSG